MFQTMMYGLKIEESLYVREKRHRCTKPRSSQLELITTLDLCSCSLPPFPVNVTLLLCHAGCFPVKVLFCQMWENPLSLWIKETLCTKYMRGEGGIHKEEEVRRRTVSGKI